MLKLPKGLKKKKKGKKSKKDQELFTEEELKQYKREHQQQQQNKTTVDESDGASSITNVETKSTDGSGKEKNVQDDEWSKFNALTAGVDSILHKTQDDLDRIKSTSFFKRVPPPSEKKKQQEQAQAAAQQLEAQKAKQLEEEKEASRDKLAEAVVVLSESEEESEEADDIFDTEYIDAITSGEVQLTVVPDSPDLEIDNGPDPFDTSYADKLIKGAEVSKRGKKLVNIGSAVEVLTGRVETVQPISSGTKRKPRRGIQNLLLDDFTADEGATDFDILDTTPDPPRTLLDDPTDLLSDAPIDLSVSLHLQLLKDKQEKLAEESEPAAAEVDTSEFDIFKNTEDDDDFAELAAESLKKKEVTVFSEPQAIAPKLDTDFAEFEDNIKADTDDQGSHLNSYSNPEEESIEADDPFDTTFASKLLPGSQIVEEEDDDFDFNPRAEEPIKADIKVEENVEEDLLGERKASVVGSDTVNTLRPLQKDILGGSITDLTDHSSPIVPIQKVETEEEVIDPFDTSAVDSLVQPKRTELKFLEEELLKDTFSDFEFDPRAEESKPTSSGVVAPQKDFDAARRKSSLSLNFQSKSVVFLVPQNNPLGGNNDHAKIQKPLTPYYAKEQLEQTDPFQTSLVTGDKQEDNFDTDFDPRAGETTVKSDLLAVDDNIDIKVLTPCQIDTVATEVEGESAWCLDPFDTSIATNVQPGKAELKVIEKELLSSGTPVVSNAGVLESLTDAQELGLGDKVLTPQAPLNESLSLEEVDPFDTSFADNLGPGKAEIKLLETELIDH